MIVTFARREVAVVVTSFKRPPFSTGINCWDHKSHKMPLAFSSPDEETFFIVFTTTIYIGGPGGSMEKPLARKTLCSIYSSWLL